MAYTVGQRVRARQQVTESGNIPGDSLAAFPNPFYIHAEAGELGTIVHVEPTDDDERFFPTVMFDRTKTATRVRGIKTLQGDVEIEVMS